MPRKIKETLQGIVDYLYKVDLSTRHLRRSDRLGMNTVLQKGEGTDRSLHD